MEQKRYEFILTANQPIAHHQETFGNTSILMRQSIMSPDGKLVDVPVITGDTMRHGLREAGSYALLDAAGLLEESLTEEALRLLFSGGVIQGTRSAISIQEYREMVDLLPHLSLLGGCAGNRVIPGKLQVDYARLICKETEHMMPGWVTDWIDEKQDNEELKLHSCRKMISEETRTRMDPTLDTEKRELLTSDDREDVRKRLEASEKASVLEKFEKKEEEKSSMMPRSFETIVAGSQFHWSVTATTHDDLERDTLMVMIGSFLSDAVVGGKRGSGHGKLEAMQGHEVEIQVAGPDGENFALSEKSIGDLYSEHVSERSSEIKKLLDQIEA